MATSSPVSEFESPKLKIAGKLESTDLARGKKMETKVRTWRMKVLLAMA